MTSEKGDNMHIIIGAFLLLGIIINQLREKPMTGKLYRQPLLLFFFACVAASELPVISVGDWAMMLSSLLLAFCFGLIQGRYTRLTNHEGAWFVSGSFIALLVWFVSIPIRYGLKYLFMHTAFAIHLDGMSSYIIYFLSIAGLLFGKYTMLLLRHPSLVKKMAQNERKLQRMREAR